MSRERKGRPATGPNRTSGRGPPPKRGGGAKTVRDRPPPPPEPRAPGPGQRTRPDDIAGGAPAADATSARGALDGRLGRVHDRALDITALLVERVPLERALDMVFRRSRDLGSSERAELTDLAYAFARTERRLDDGIARAAKQVRRDISILDAPIRARLRLLALHLDRGATLAELEALDAYAFKRVPGLFEALARGVPIPASRSAAVRIGVERSLPEPVVERLVAAYGESRADAMGAALLERAPFTVRVALHKMTREQAQARILAELGVASAPTPLSPAGLILERRVALGDKAIFEEGLIEPQDEGSQLIALAVGAQPGDVVYDVCAGAGGKTLALGAAMRGNGRLLAFDRDDDKLTELKKRARRAGLTNHQTHAVDFVTFPSELAGRADRVLVDAPCSGSGTFRRHPDARWHVTETHLRELPTRQLTLLQRAADAAKPGGLVLYATCSILPQENEAVVAAALTNDPRLEPVPLATTLGAEVAAALGATHEARIGPGPGPRDPDGFYFALLRRRL